MSTKEQAGIGRTQVAVAATERAPELLNLPAVEPNPRGHRPGQRCREPDCGDCRWDVQRMKYWLRGWLLACGADDAEVDKPLGAQTAGLLWHRESRLCAIEIRSAPVSLEQARERTTRLRAVGCEEVLWLCPPGYWVPRIQAMAVDDFAPDGCGYQVTAGLLELTHSGLATPSARTYTLREFIEDWVAGRVAWGIRDEDTGGWATVTDWEQHTSAQAAVIAAQRRELVHQRTALALARRATRKKERQLDRLQRDLVEAEEVAQRLAVTRRRLDDHNRVDAGLRYAIERERVAVRHWQLITWFAVFIVVTFLMAAMILAQR
ncbi:hypothetical protein [Nocardia sp. BMG111209]|uniref:hypothetical protein n=1 Tax=Nocardia sp. BMG111209 TaxID=1160137 RepID=UPI000377D8EB|nr:hypothetical protein [Nocardia sp. BMG111209]